MKARYFFIFFVLILLFFFLFIMNRENYDEHDEHYEHYENENYKIISGPNRYTSYPVVEVSTNGKNPSCYRRSMVVC
jgi:hypothetical protein